MAFFNFLRRRPLPSWILQILMFNCPNGQKGRTASSCQISSKSLEPRLRFGVNIVDLSHDISEAVRPIGKKFATMTHSANEC